MMRKPLAPSGLGPSGRLRGTCHETLSARLRTTNDRDRYVRPSAL